jgi:hypothetical protein
MTMLRKILFYAESVVVCLAQSIYNGLKVVCLMESAYLLYLAIRWMEFVVWGN